MYWWQWKGNINFVSLSYIFVLQPKSDSLTIFSYSNFTMFLSFSVNCARKFKMSCCRITVGLYGDVLWRQAQTWTGDPPIESSSLTVRYADPASSSWVHFSPCLVQKYTVWMSCRLGLGVVGQHVFTLPYHLDLLLYTWTTLCPCLYRPSFSSPGVYDVLLAASQSVGVEDEVTISSIEVTVQGGIHWYLVTVLNTPDLKGRQHLVCSQLP